MAIKLINDGVTASLRRIQSELSKLPAEAHRVFVSVTPKDTGNARRQTRLSGNTIEANYSYAGALDKGWSKQAPQGMTKPTERFIKNRLDKIMRK